MSLDILKSQFNFIQEDDRLSKFTQQDQVQFKQLYEKISQSQVQKKNLQVIQYKLKMTSCLQVQESSNSKKIVQYPVSFRDCKHPDKCMDFLQIYKMLKVSSVKEISCECLVKYSKSNCIENLQVDPQFKFLMKKIHSTHHEVDLYDQIGTQNYFIHPSIQLQGENKKVLQASQKDILDFFIKQNNQIANNFSQFIPQNVQNSEYRATCLLSLTKLSIPVRYKDCKHLEVYDLVNLLILIDRNSKLQQKEIKKDFECKYTQCKSKIPLDKHLLFSSIGLDQQLLNALLQGVSFSNNYYYQFDQQTGTVVVQNILAVQNRDPFINYFNQNNDFKLIFDIWHKTSKVVSKGASDKLSDASVQNRLLDDYEVDLRDKITNLPVEIPTRCKNCTNKNHVMELRSIIYLIVQRQNKVCPLCQNEFVYPEINQLWVDYDLQRQIYKSGNQIQQNQKLKINGKENVKQMFLKVRKLTLADFLNLQDVINSKKIRFYSTICQISKNRLKFPLIYGECNHDYYFDFDSVVESYRKDKFRSLKLCQDCIENNAQEIKISNFIFNECLKDFMDQNPQMNSIEYNIETKTFKQLPQNQIRNVPQNIPKSKGNSFYDLMELPAEIQSYFVEQTFENIKYRVIEQKKDGIIINKNGINCDQFINNAIEVEKSIESQFGFKVTVKQVGLGVNQIINVEEMRKQNNLQTQKQQGTQPLVNNQQNNFVDNKESQQKNFQSQEIPRIISKKKSKIILLPQKEKQIQQFSDSQELHGQEIPQNQQIQNQFYQYNQNNLSPFQGQIKTSNQNPQQPFFQYNNSVYQYIPQDQLNYNMEQQNQNMNPQGLNQQIQQYNYTQNNDFKQINQNQSQYIQFGQNFIPNQQNFGSNEQIYQMQQNFQQMQINPSQQIQQFQTYPAQNNLQQGQQFKNQIQFYRQ